MLLIVFFAIIGFLLIFVLIDLFCERNSTKEKCIQHDWYKSHSATYKCKKCGLVRMKWESKN